MAKVLKWINIIRDDKQSFLYGLYSVKSFLFNDMAVLITGGAGFIGSHTALVLLQAGYQLVILDNFSNSSKKVIKRIKELAGECVKNHLLVIEGDIRDKNTLKKVFSQKAFAIEAVIHFAGLKAVGESQCSWHSQLTANHARE